VLNELQSNAQIRAEIVANRKQNVEMILPQTLKTAELMGVSEKMLNSLSIIHVAGTKGKGTTCAFTESILRHAGLRTGFFSSPHLIEARERIKINGKPISPEKFAHYFFKTYETFMSSKVSTKLENLPFGYNLQSIFKESRFLLNRKKTFQLRLISDFSHAWLSTYSYKRK